MALNTVVFPVAGLGTRFLPATKTVPKEMLPVVDRPLIQYAVEEALAAGARRLVFVTGRTKGAIGDYFDKAYELETELARRGKQDVLDMLDGLLPSDAECLYVRQPEALGLGHAILCARSLVSDEAFGIILPDDLIHHPIDPVMAQLARHREATGASVISVEAVPMERTQAYGVVDVDVDVELQNGRACRINGIVEKPAPENAPSNLAVVGRYLLSSSIFEWLERIRPDHRGEIQLTDAIAELLKREAVDAYQFEGQHFDCGSKLGFLQATVHFGKRHPEIGEAFSDWLGSL